MGKLWRTCLGQNLGAREGGWSAGYEESSGPELKKEEGQKRGEERAKISN